MPTVEEVWKSVAPLWLAVKGEESPADSEATVFAIPTSDVDQTAKLPEGGNVVGAPMGDFDVVEVTQFGRPAGRARIAFGERLAVVGRFEFEADFTPEDFGPALLAALAEEAFLEGAETIYTVANRNGLPSFLGDRWSESGPVPQA